MSAAKATPTTISGTVSRYPDWLSRVTPSAAMTTNGTAHAATMTVISAGLNRDLPLTPAVARAADGDCRGVVDDHERGHDQEGRATRAFVGMLAAHGEPDRAEGSQDQDGPDGQEPGLGGLELAPCLPSGLVKERRRLARVEGAAVAPAVVSGVGFMMSPSDLLYAIK